MGYVRTREEIEAIKALLQPSYFTLEGMGVEFTTTRDFVASVLPPCFDVPDQPRGVARVARWQSAVCGEFESCAVMIDARYGDLVGSYYLTLFVSGDMPVTIGREMWGEPKKLGHSAFYRDGDDIYAYGERNGVRAVEISGSFGPDLGPRSVSGHALELKAEVAPDGELLGDPSVLVFDVDLSWTSFREGHGTLTFNGTPWDPVDQIPVESTGPATHYTGEMRNRCADRTVLPDRAAYVPYVLGRHFDDLRLFPVPRRHAAVLG